MPLTFFQRRVWTFFPSFTSKALLTRVDAYVVSECVRKKKVNYYTCTYVWKENKRQKENEKTDDTRNLTRTEVHAHIHPHTRTRTPTHTYTYAHTYVCSYVNIIHMHIWSTLLHRGHPNKNQCFLSFLHLRQKNGEIVPNGCVENHSTPSADSTALTLTLYIYAYMWRWGKCKRTTHIYLYMCIHAHGYHRKWW